MQISFLLANLPARLLVLLCLVVYLAFPCGTVFAANNATPSSSSSSVNPSSPTLAPSNLQTTSAKGLSDDQQRTFRENIGYLNVGRGCSDQASQPSTTTTSGGTTSGTTTISGPFLPKAMPGDNVKVGDSYKGPASTYGNDPLTGYVDPGDVGSNGQPLKPALSGASNAQPAIAVYNSGTLGGWWAIIAPNGKLAILQQTDLGPSTSDIVDINSVAARTVFGYKEGNGFPTGQGDWKIQYLGQKQPGGAITKAGTSGSQTVPTSTGSPGSCCDTSSSVSSLSGKDNAAKAINFFTSSSIGLTYAQAVGVVQNLINESNVNPLVGGPTPTSGGVWGVAQWTGASVDMYIKDKASNHIQGSDSQLLTQLQVLWAEMEGKGVYNGGADIATGLKKIAGDTPSAASQAAVYFRDSFERCNLGYSSCGNRGSDAAKSFNTFKSLDNGSAGAAVGGAVSGSGGCPVTAGGNISAYQDPLRKIKGLQPTRIDEGVDYCGSGPIYAVGNGKVTYVGSGWFSNYGPSVVYKLTDGPAAGKFIYFAEHITTSVNVGDSVTSNSVIATMQAGSPCTETGWSLNGGSDEPAAGPQYHSYPDGTAMAYGRNFSDFMKAIGSKGGLLSRSTNPSVVGGSLASGWPTKW